MIRVLIVEDDPMVAHLNTKYVESIEGFKVIGHVMNGEDAAKFCESNKLDLIILDIYMPKVDGTQFIKNLRKSNQMTDIIIVSASTDTSIINMMLSLGVIDYLIKPFEYERFKQALENYMNRKDILTGNENIGQEELDRMTGTSQNAGREYVAKGLHKNTLERIISYFKQRNDRAMTSEELGEALDLSKVTIRRYMDYLESVGKVKMEVQYGTVGRPSYLYRYIEN